MVIRIAPWDSPICPESVEEGPVSWEGEGEDGKELQYYLIWNDSTIGYVAGIISTSCKKCHQKLPINTSIYSHNSISAKIVLYLMGSSNFVPYQQEHRLVVNPRFIGLIYIPVLP